MGIKVPLNPTALKEVKNGQEITIRGRFATRKEGNVIMSNCSLVK